MNHWRVMVALRLFGTASGNRLMSFVGILSISGLTVAVAVLLTVLSVVNGFERELRERVLAVLPHGTVMSRGTSVDWSAEARKFREHPDVLGAAPVVEGAGLLVRDGELTGVTFKGIDTLQEAQVSILPRFVSDGALEALAATRYGVLLGEGLADKLQIKTGDKVALVLPNVSFSLAGPVVTTKRLLVTGTFKTGADMDNSYIYLNIDDARKLKRQKDIDGIVIKVRDLFEVHTVLYDLVSDADSRELYGVSWMRQNGNLYDAIGTQKATLFLLLLILVAVATFNVVSNLVMTVDGNRGEIAILKTMGASPLDLSVIFMIHGVLVGAIGLMLGLGFGALLTVSLSWIYTTLSNVFSLELMNEYFVHYLPTEIQALDVLLITMVCLVISLLATLYPAWRAAMANPVEALQYDV